MRCSGRSSSYAMQQSEAPPSTLRVPPQRFRGEGTTAVARGSDTKHTFSRSGVGKPTEHRVRGRKGLQRPPPRPSVPMPAKGPRRARAAQSPTAVAAPPASPPTRPPSLPLPTDTRQRPVRRSPRAANALRSRFAPGRTEEPSRQSRRGRRRTDQRALGDGSETFLKTCGPNAHPSQGGFVTAVCDF